MLKQKNESDPQNRLDPKNMSDYEYISDLTAIAGQEKASFDSAVNWTLMITTAGLLCIATLWNEQCQQNDLFLQLVLLILMFITSMFSRRAYRGYMKYYEYCNARRRTLKNLAENSEKKFQIDKDDTRGKLMTKQTWWGFLLTTEFAYIFLIQVGLYVHLTRAKWCLLIVTILVCVCYWSTSCIIPEKLPKEQDLSSIIKCTT